jgi:type II secretion system protein C
MKHPFWIANSILLFVFVMILLGISYMGTPLPERADIEPTRSAAQETTEALPLDVEKIYEQDLFGTYQEKAPLPVEKGVPPIPQPPKPQVAVVPPVATPQFIDPLNITLKGILVVSVQEEKNRAIIQDNKTTVEKTYKVGDAVEDAQLIRIFSNKIILLRSNGQQEVLYLREQDAQLDPAYAAIASWADAIQEVKRDQFAINTTEFLLRIKNLAQFIDLLGLTTAYKDGKSVGCRVGEVEDKSLGYYLGLKTGDIIKTINGIATTTTDNRLKIYKTILETRDEGVIQVILTRNNDEHELLYVIQSNKPSKRDQQKLALAKQEEEAKKLKILEQKHTFAPTMQEIRMHEKELMQKQGTMPRTQTPEQEIGIEKQ